jgi:hypothetical protein
MENVQKWLDKLQSPSPDLSTVIEKYLVKREEAIRKLKERLVRG